MNKITTSLHILALVALSLNYFEIVFMYTINGSYLLLNRAYTVQYFILGASDIFICFMLWFMMDSNDKPLFMEN